MSLALHKAKCMARPREFDADSVLERAMQIFWSQGYEATSLDDLCAKTGLSRSSLYAAFGDKRGLLLKSLERYVDHGSDFIARALTRKTPLRAALANLFDEFIDGIVAGPGRRGCFIGNCAAEFAGHDRDAMVHVRDALERNTGYFRAALAAAQNRKEISATADIDALARFLSAGIQGLQLVGKTNPDRAVLKDVAAVMLRCLDD
jgi:TetR/AcrR family transcriptional regulator, transcriptional repressor for nem operon